jgi:hypothetical protein
MNPFVKKSLIAVSVSFNVIFSLFIFFAVTRKTSSLAFYSPGSGEGQYASASCIVSVPSLNADLLLGAPEFSLMPGETAFLQFSLFFRRRQIDLALEPLYDRAVVSVERTGYGIAINALSPGETVLQTITGEGIKNIAVVKVGSFYE